jgi:hypothetical protein
VIWLKKDIGQKSKTELKKKRNNKMYSILLFVLITSLGFGIHCLVVGFEEAMKELWAVVIYAFAALIITPIISLIWHMVREPALLHDEQKKINDKQRKIIEKYQSNELIVNVAKFESINNNGNSGLCY